MTREILLFGTSANPFVGMEGHLGAAAYCRSLGFDEVWILPVYQHIYSTKRALAPFDDRLAMSQLAVDTLPPLSPSQRPGGREGLVLVKPFERELFEQAAQSTDKPEDLRLGSIDLVRFLTQRFPEASFTMLLGGDTFADLQAGKWKCGDELKRLTKLLVMNRLGYDAPDRTEESDRIRFVTIPSLSDISSTYVRSLHDETELRRCLPPQVAEYIMQHKLYGFSA
jgi:nicotinate-nucleotide adenylyltransferase